jgi:amino acid adenylation domain-containing protein
MPAGTLHELLTASARRDPGARAVEDPATGAIAYDDLDALSDQLRDRLVHWGVRPGDRVGIYLRKSIDAVASIFGILKAGAAYVPIDPGAPAERNAYILNDCAVRAAVVERRFEERLRAELGALGPIPPMLVLEGTEAGRSLRAALEAAGPAPAAPAVEPGPDALAYILYTSGSTGRPKGVMLSHRNAASFVDWCSDTFAPRPTDRFSSHAPFHFDLSVLDLFLAVKHGAAVVLVGEDVGKDPVRLAALIAERRLSVWYSAPSILSLLAEYGKLERHDCSALRLVLFAGEVFPVKHLRNLTRLLPRPRYWNLYGPTETNVCTAFEVPLPVADDRTAPFPIGATCSHLRSRVVDEHGVDVPPGQEGELVVAGDGVMQGYWNLPELTSRAFLEHAGARWYRTGDIVVQAPDGGHVFRGRRDRMVKRRGYRIELGEIEAGLYRHPAVKEAAVIAVPEADGGGVQIKAFVGLQGERRPSLIEIKRFCAEHLPLYMVPDHFTFDEALPKTSTDKIDYQRLRERA